MQFEYAICPVTKELEVRDKLRRENKLISSQTSVFIGNFIVHQRHNMNFNHQENLKILAFVKILELYKFYDYN